MRIFLTFAIVLIITAFSSTNAAVPQLINYQGVLADSTGAGLDTTVNVTFSIYESAVSPTPIWLEVHGSVTVTGGLFSVLLGSITPLDVTIFDTPFRYLGIRVGADPEITPRSQLVSVPYSFQSEHADIADLALFADSAGIAKFADTAALAVLALVAELAIFADSARVADELDSLSSEDFSRTGHSHGSTSGWTDDGTVVRLDASGDSVGIGTTTPSEKLDVVGNLIVSGKANIGSGNANAGLNAFVTGQSNSASGDYSTVGGGQFDTASGLISTVGGGQNNTASGIRSTVGGGQNNTASITFATVSGGLLNNASGNSATVGGGFSNTANGPQSTVGGGQFNTASGIQSTIGGGESNTASNFAATVGGGQANFASGQLSTVGGGINNSADSTYATVGGGDGNTASGPWSTVGGGFSNLAADSAATVSGGSYNNARGIYSVIAGGGGAITSDSNSASGPYSAIGGGRRNTASDSYATVSGGFQNIASGSIATIPGGLRNSASADLSFAAGFNAKADHAGSFVLAANNSHIGTDSINSGGDEQMVLRVDGGLYLTNTFEIAPYDPAKIITTRGGAYLSGNGTTWTNASDKNQKENFTAIDSEDLLEKISALPISRWNYKDEDETVTHIGPVAQDFYALFGVGSDDISISTIDPAGIALAAIQELIKKSKRVDALEQNNRELNERLEKLEKMIDELSKK